MASSGAFLFVDDAGEKIFETERHANVAVLQPPGDADWFEPDTTLTPR
jgi:hypothetical protein